MSEKLKISLVKMNRILNYSFIIFLFLLIGCKNPLDTSGIEKSSVDDNYSPYLLAPGGFSFTSSSILSGQISFSWSASERVASYQVKYGTSSGSYPTTSACTSSPCTISGLTNGTTYYVTVTATNIKGTTSISSELAISLSAPTSFSITNVTPTGAGSLQITWGNSTGATTYSIKYGTTSGNYTTTLTNQTSPATISGLSAGTVYYVQLLATNSYGSLASSNELSGSVYQNFALDIPFAATTEASYVLSNSTTTEFSSGVARLTTVNQTDDDNTNSGFGGATHSGTIWDETNGYLRLNTATNNAELDSSWTPQWANLISYNKFNGANGVVASGSVLTSTVGANCTNGGTSARSTGKFNEAISTVTIYCSEANVYTQGSALTVSKWINDSGTGGSWNGYWATLETNRGIWTGRSGSSNSIMTRIDTSAGINQTCASTKSVFGDGAWHHIVFTFGSGFQKIYIDGVLDSTCSYNIGGGFASDGNYVGNFNTSTSQLLDDYSVWNTVLTENEIATIYNRQSAKYSGLTLSRIMDALNPLSWTSISTSTTLPFFKELPGNSGSESSTNYSALVGSTGSTADNNLMNGLMGLWHLNETSGSAITDYSGNSRHATLSGSPTVGVEGQFGKSIYMGTSASNMMSVTALDTTSFPTIGTLSFWLKISDYTSANIGIFDNYATTRNHLFIRGYSTNRLQIALQDSSPTTYVAVKDLSYTANQWHLITISWSSSSQILKVYKDGLSLASLPYNRAFNLDGQNFIFSGGSSKFNYLDEVGLWNRVLNDTEVTQLYRRGTNKIKYQIRSCSASDCSDQEALSSGKGWKGPDNSFRSYFSELHNNTAINSTGDSSGNVNTSAMNLLFTNFSASNLSVANNRYFQYRVILESDDQNSLCNYGSGATTCSPELKAVAIGPNHYDINNPTVTSNSSIGSLFQILDTSGFVESLGSGGCTGARYTISGNGTQFYYHNGTAWALADDTYTKANSASTVASNLSTLIATMGTGTIQIKTFLHSDGVTACEVSNIRITGKKY